MTRLCVFVALGFVAAAGSATAQAPAVPPVTDAMLQDPAPGDWLMWRRTLNGWGYSPLDQITRENVNDLRLVWTRALSSGYQGRHAAGLRRHPVHDATSGAELWRTRRVPAPGEPGDETWGGVPYEERVHVGSWMVPSYDPDLDLVYVGTSVTSPAPTFCWEARTSSTSTTTRRLRSTPTPARSAGITRT